MVSQIDIDIRRYTPSDKIIWNQFVSDSKNGTFLLNRDFMEYHSDRYTDHSLLFYHKNILLALLPANINDGILYSHQGLTYGGLILSSYTKITHVLAIFSALKKYLRAQNVTTLIYKPIPHIYHIQPAEEDLYALHQNGAKLIGRSISSAIVFDDAIGYSKLRLRGIKKAESQNFEIKENLDLSFFWDVLEENLKQKYNVRPTHTLSEIQFLQSKFPENIKLYEIWNNEVILAGCITFDSVSTRHLQYISASKIGKDKNALDLLLNRVILSSYNSFKCFDFGISTEKNGAYLNDGLISQKEGFGARAIVYDMYQLDL